MNSKKKILPILYVLFAGKWLFCIRKPPKTEEECSEMTHHQRAHVKLNRWDMFGEEKGRSNQSLEVSFDDKAYVRPGTDGMFSNVSWLTIR